MFSPTMDRWVSFQQILEYLKVAPRRGILYKDHDHMKIECVSDANWVGSREGRRATYEYWRQFVS